MRVGKVTEAFQKLIKIEEKRKLLLEAKKKSIRKLRNIIVLYTKEGWTMSSQMKRKQEATEISSHRMKLSIPWIARVNNEDPSCQNSTLVLRIGKKRDS